MIEAKTLRNGILRKLEMWFSETSVCLGSLAFSKPTSTFGLKLLNHLKPGGNEPCSHTEADLTAGLVGKLWLWRGQQIWSWGGPKNYITFQNLFFFKCSNLSGKNCEILCIGGIGWAGRKVSFYLLNNLDTNCHKILLKMIMLTMMASSSIICLCSHKSRSLGMKAKSRASGQMHLLYSWTLDSDILGGHDNVTGHPLHN